MARVDAWFSRLTPTALLAASVATLLLLGVAFVVVANATDQSAFCRSCHEMTPYHDAWSKGPHKDVSCVECHVDAGQTARWEHKVVALGEVVAHVRGDRSFPRTVPPKVPDERCTSCHQKVEIENLTFDHAFHATRGSCVKCHAATGHAVSVGALRAAGIYSGVSTQTPSASASKIAVVDGGKANLPGHRTVFCSRCHIMAGTPCSACHNPPHKSRGACSMCHAPGPAFVFSHPKNRTDCQTCHTTGANHTKIAGACSDCHKQPGVAWSFAHPAKTANCTACHARPAKHAAGACTQCHAAGVSWAFRHPSATNCSACHKAPANHFGSACASCHSPSRAWKNATFQHPRIPGGQHTYRSFACVNCHPQGFSSASCAKCHGSAGGPGGG